MSHQHNPQCGCSDEAKESIRIDSLLPAIDKDHIICLNEYQPGAGRSIFKPYSDRFSNDVLKSNDRDNELLLIIPFTVAVKLRSLAFITSGDTGVRTVKLYINREDIDLSNVNEIQPIQTLSIQDDTQGDIDYTVKVSKFQNVSTLIMYLTGNEINESGIEIQYCGLKGERTNDKRGIVNAVYEARPIPEDHTAGDEYLSQQYSYDAKESGYYHKEPH